MKSHVTAGIFLLSCALLAQGWRENFQELKTSSKPESGKWLISDNLRMTQNSNSFEIVGLKGTPLVARSIPYDFTGPVRYLQIRVLACSRLVTMGTNIGPLLGWIHYQPGLYTVPVYETARPDLNKKPLKGSMNFSLRIMSGKFQFGELAMVDDHATDGVFITVSGPDGKVKDSRSAAVAGDTMTIEMQVKDKPDKLSLCLYQINDGKDWVNRGRFEAVTLPGVPIDLKSTEFPNRYRASFKLQKTANGLKIKGGKLVVAINYLGADSNNRGYYYGFCANPVELEER